ncbi:hypothetical protein ACFV2X_55630 [Streptomyces sp. NPDC059679]|uniref:hypothetical protein n=1 Tax=Streptomyces sp. NPDC059679 TaxID=3346903 RepID=UPI00367CBC6F
MQTRVRMDALADALEDALDQIKELRERLDHLAVARTAGSSSERWRVGDPVPEGLQKRD